MRRRLLDTPWRVLQPLAALQQAHSKPSGESRRSVVTESTEHLRSPCVQIASFYFQASKKPISPGIRPGYSSTSALSIINPGREVSPQCDGG